MKQYQGVPYRLDHPKKQYGFIPGIKSVDGGFLDIFVGRRKKAGKVFVLYLSKRKNGRMLREPKLVVGCESLNEAKKMFIRKYGKGRKIIHKKVVTIESLKEELRKWRHSFLATV